MASITLRSAVGRPLTNSEVDANFSALNLELGQKLVASLNLLDLPNPAQARSNLGLGNVENKSSATIRGELTSGNVTSALGYTPLSTAGGTLSGQLLLNYAGSMVRVQDGSNVLSLGHWDGANVRIESVGRPMFLASYGGDITIGNVYGSGSLVVSGSGVSFAGHSVLHSANYNSYALPLSGGTLSGTLFANAGIRIPMNDYEISFGYNGSGGGVGVYFNNAFDALTFYNRTGGANAAEIRRTGGINSVGALTENGSQVLHAGNYTNYVGIVRSKGHVGPGVTDWNSLANNNPNSIYAIYHENFGGNGSPSPSYTYGSILNFDTFSNSQAQIYVSHQGNDLMFRGGWAGSGWTSWNRVLTNINFSSYAIALSGATGVSGYFKKNIVSAEGATSGGTGYVQSTQRDIIGWKIIGSISLDNPGSGGTQFIDLRTNIISESAMLFFKLEGYAYNYGNVNCYHGLYMYSGLLILNKFTNNLGNSVTFYDSYKDGSGYLCLKINLGQTGYTSAVARLFVTSHDDGFDWATVTAVKRSNSTSPQF